VSGCEFGSWIGGFIPIALGTASETMHREIGAAQPSQFQREEEDRSKSMVDGARFDRSILPLACCLGQKKGSDNVCGRHAGTRED